MISRFILLFSFILPISLLGQVRTNVGATKDVIIAKSNANQRSMMMCNEAGTVTVSRPTGDTQDIEFLCAGDSLRLDHGGNQDLSGDPDGSTMPGIVYLFYRDMPDAAFSGPDLATITTDPNIILDGSGFPIVDGVTDEFGNGFFNNNQTVRDAFISLSIPSEVYYAPATIDDHTALAWEGTPTPIGPCVDVNTDEAFRLVYLNPIEVVNPVINGCSGAFTVLGGLPEFDGNVNYNSINIENLADRSIKATVTVNGTTASHNSVVEFVITVPGQYEILVTDDKGCPGSTIVDLTSTCSNAGLSVGVMATPLGCGANAFGQLEVSMAGGVTPYTLTVSRNGSNLAGFPQTVASPQAFQLATTQTGNYTVQVTDSANPAERFNETIEIIDLDDFGLNVNVLNQVNCRGESTGQLAVEITDPSGAIVTNPGAEYEFLWSNGVTNDTITDVMPGPYSVMVKFMGEDLCLIPNASLNNPAELGLATVPTITTPSCPSDNGRIDISPTGGTPFATGGNYQVDWFLKDTDGSVSGVSSGRDINFLESAAARYYAVITDANNCSFSTDTLDLLDPPSITIAFQDSLPTSCAVGNPEDGAVTVFASGGNSNTYVFTWMNPVGETSGGFTASHRATALTAGFNVVTVTDLNGCMAVDSVSIPAPPAITFDSIRTTATSCFGDMDGTAFVRATGGSGTYTYAWDNGASGDLISGLTQGTYTVRATDTNNCPSVPFVVNVNQPDTMIVFVDDLTSISCNGEVDGIIEVAVQGGNTGVLDYNWNTSNPADTTSILTSLSQGTYSVTVTDSKGCQDTTSAILMQPVPVQAVFEIDSIMCNGTSTLITVDTAFGGIGGPYVYSVDGFNFQPINTPIPLGAGTYSLIVRDINDCEFEEPYVLGEPAPLLVELSGVSINTFGVGIPEPLVIDDTQTPPATEIELGDSIRLDITTLGVQGSIDSISWTTSPVNFSLCPTSDCTEVGFFSTDDVLANVLVVDDMGCEGNAQLFIEVDRNRKLYIPNTFNPDSNEFTNRLFRVFAGQGVTEVVEMKVFNRWGALVFGADNFDPKVTEDIGWDGTLNGKRVNPDVFVYVVKVLFDDGIELTYRGSVTLLY